METGTSLFYEGQNVSLQLFLWRHMLIYGHHSVLLHDRKETVEPMGTSPSPTVLYLVWSKKKGVGVEHYWKCQIPNSLMEVAALDRR